MYKFFILIHGLVSGNEEEKFQEAENKEIYNALVTEADISSKSKGTNSSNDSKKFSGRL